jgi:hypothetical protein
LEASNTPPTTVQTQLDHFRNWMMLTRSKRRREGFVSVDEAISDSGGIILGSGDRSVNSP